MEKAFVVNTKGYSMEAVVEYQHHRLVVMDRFSPPGGRSEPDFIHNARFACMTFVPDNREELCNSRDDGRKEISHLDGWNYRASGQVLAVNPTVIDVGLFQLEGDIPIDNRCVGKFVTGKIVRLELAGQPLRPVRLQRPFLGKR